MRNHALNIAAFGFAAAAGVILISLPLGPGLLALAALATAYAALMRLREAEIADAIEGEDR